MKVFTTTLLACILLFSCNLEPDRQLNEAELLALEKAKADSITVVIENWRADSLACALKEAKAKTGTKKRIRKTKKKVKVHAPPLYTKENFDSVTVVRFKELAQQTEGELKLLVKSRLISGEIINTIQTHAVERADILFLIDKTGSMRDDLYNIKKGLPQIITALEGFENVRLAIALYGDKNQDKKNWYTFQNFENDFKASKQFIQNMNVAKGGDTPESVYEGFFESQKQGFWSSNSKRMILLIGDAPPLEKPASEYSVTDVIRAANSGGIKMNFYPIIVDPTKAMTTMAPEAVVGKVDAPKTKTEVAAKKPVKEPELIKKLYPNPSSGAFTLNLHQTDTYTLRIFNLKGQMVLEEKFKDNVWVYNKDALENGKYFVRIKNSKGKVETEPLVIDNVR